MESLNGFRPLRSAETTQLDDRRIRSDSGQVVKSELERARQKIQPAPAKTSFGCSAAPMPLRHIPVIRTAG